ncbi:MAG: hypothetical protein GY862_18480, partial [Gammaproteobacteria bacterium]|nr:hypothetical protein [Gammaproteobacteria bacterium]
LFYEFLLFQFTVHNAWTGPTKLPDPMLQVVWCCPKCRREHSSQQTPSRYLCFCGKVTDPPFDQWLAPHSCGQVCGRPLAPNCGHTCLLLCHPGACPACPQIVAVSCHCAKSAPAARRCGLQAWACARECGQSLGCGRHRCERTCHEGDCGPCEKSSKRRCRCGGREEERPCLDGDWSCGQVCGNALQPCGKHQCQVEIRMAVKEYVQFR